MTAVYDALADVYDLWAAADPASGPTLQFYSDLFVSAGCTVVELCVGTGRIALESAGRGARIIGVDVAPRMLDRCRARAAALGLSDRVDLSLQDARCLSLAEQVELIACPFRSIGHFIDYADKRRLFERVYKHLRPGGRFIFDHYLWSEAWARTHDRIPRLMVDSRTADGGVLVWDTYQYDFPKRRMSCTILVQRLDASGRISEAIAPKFEFTWLDPEEVRALAGEVGFICEAVHGDFAGGPLTVGASDQVWVLRRPSESS